MAEAAKAGNVIPFPAGLQTVEQRAALVRAYLASKEPKIEIRTVPQAVALLDQWQAHAERMEALHALATIRAEMSELLLADALAECERLRGLIK